MTLSASGGAQADVSCRIAWADDADAIAGRPGARLAHVVRGLLPAELLESLDRDALAAGWRTSLVQPAEARQRVLVALERNTVTGFALTSPAVDPDADPSSEGEVADLTVDPERRGQGHASRLMQACVDTLVADGFTTAVIWVNVGDDDLRGFLVEAGWAPDGAHRELDLRGDGEVTVKQIRLHTAIA
jgi:GNAT superfamily N-acetyltransferase